MTRKLLLPALFALLLAFSPSTASAEKVYQITATELTMLEMNLTKQENIISQLLTEASHLKDSEGALKLELEVVLTELQSMKQELILLQVDLENSRDLLKKANKSLQEYEAEMKAKTRVLKMQRNFAYVLLGGALVYAAAA